MTPNEFFELFEKEINSYVNRNIETYNLKEYYKFYRKDSFHAWRKMYLKQRLEYIYEHIVKEYSGRSVNVWDVGCGYGTSSLFLAMNGIASKGSTLEWYHKFIPVRKEFWKEYGNPDLFRVNVENIFETEYKEKEHDVILVQDTLHHLEPISGALQVFKRALKEDGKIVIVDDNGNNIMQRIKLYMFRGNKRIIDYYDENLKKKILFGNENVRSFDQWNKIFAENGFAISDKEYIRFFPPYVMNNSNYGKLIEMEKSIWNSSKFFREYFYWGLDFIARVNHK